MSYCVLIKTKIANDYRITIIIGYCFVCDSFGKCLFTGKVNYSCLYIFAGFFEMFNKAEVAETKKRPFLKVIFQGCQQLIVKFLLEVSSFPYNEKSRNMILSRFIDEMSV